MFQFKFIPLVPEKMRVIDIKIYFDSTKNLVNPIKYDSNYKLYICLQI